MNGLRRFGRSEKRSAFRHWVNISSSSGQRLRRNALRFSDDPFAVSTTVQPRTSRLYENHGISGRTVSLLLWRSIPWDPYEMTFYSCPDRQPNEYTDLHRYVL